MAKQGAIRTGVRRLLTPFRQTPAFPTARKWYNQSRKVYNTVKESDAASMVQLHDGVIIAKFPLDKPEIRIGRDPDNDIFIDDKVVSLEHAVVEVVVDPARPNSRNYFIKDLGSTNSTFVNDKAVTRHRLTSEDLIRIGWTTFRFVEAEKRKSDKTLKIHKSWIPGVYYTKD